MKKGRADDPARPFCFKATANQQATRKERAIHEGDVERDDWQRAEGERRRPEPRFLGAVFALASPQRPTGGVVVTPKSGKPPPDHPQQQTVQQEGGGGSPQTGKAPSADEEVARTLEQQDEPGLTADEG